jgi:hypothetical protein
MSDLSLHDETVARGRQLLAGIDPGLQGTVLAELVAILIAGHHPDLRAEVEASWLEAMRDLVPIVANQYGLTRERFER